jgi:hypothetical protein
MYARLMPCIASRGPCIRRARRSKFARSLTFVGPEDDPVAVLHHAQHSQLDVGQVDPLTVHLHHKRNNRLFQIFSNLISLISLLYYITRVTRIKAIFFNKNTCRKRIIFCIKKTQTFIVHCIFTFIWNINFFLPKNKLYHRNFSLIFEKKNLQ